MAVRRAKNPSDGSKLATDGQNHPTNAIFENKPDGREKKPECRGNKPDRRDEKRE
jgi:hypothetical protein